MEEETKKLLEELKDYFRESKKNYFFNEIDKLLEGINNGNMGSGNMGSGNMGSVKILVTPTRIKSLKERMEELKKDEKYGKNKRFLILWANLLKIYPEISEDEKKMAKIENELKEIEEKIHTEKP